MAIYLRVFYVPFPEEEKTQFLQLINNGKEGLKWNPLVLSGFLYKWKQV
jgi:hypothetical protein